MLDPPLHFGVCVWPFLLFFEKRQSTQLHFGVPKVKVPDGGRGPGPLPPSGALTNGSGHANGPTLDLPEDPPFTFAWSEWLLPAEQEDAGTPKLTQATMGPY